ncbi:MAG: pimeloyl-[acyl-carrier protein] methyl ester esterase [Zhongshania sp.]
MSESKAPVSHNNIKHWVFLRGLSREQGHWGDFIARCERELGWHCYAIDLPGFGSEYQRTSPASIAAIREDVQARLPSTITESNEKFGLIAMSLGGMLAIDWLAASPQQIGTVFLINSSTADCPLHHRLTWQSLASTLIALLSPSVKKQEMTALKMVSNKHGNDLQVLQTWCELRQMRPPKKSNVIRQLLAAARFHSPATTAMLDANCTVLSSCGDRMVSKQCSERIAQKYQWPLQLHSNAGHDLVIDDPDWLLDIFTRESVSANH